MTELSADDVHARVALAHTPYHLVLDALVREALERFAAVVVLDLHSFGMPVGVDVVIGNARGSTCSDEVLGGLEAAFVNHDFSVACNKPWSGGWITRKFADHPSIHSVQIELNQRVYLRVEEIDLDDWRRPTFDAERVRAGAKRLSAVFSDFVQRVGPSGPSGRGSA